MSAFTSYRLRLQRRRWRIRAFRKRRELKLVASRLERLRRDSIILICTIRNERIRLPYFLDYYRRLGVQHFMFVDNGSDDGSREYLSEQPDVSLWMTEASYKRSRFGTDWVNWLLSKYAHGHWCVVVDSDEFFVYPFCDTRPLRALTDWLEASSIRSFGVMTIDMYPKGQIDAQRYVEGQNPMEITSWFDSGNYVIQKNSKFGNLWIQGGPRARIFFADNPARSPALNKIPLVKWQRKYVFVSSTHMLLPRGLNMVYDEWGGEKTSGCLLHAKFLHFLTDKSAEELERREHFAASHEYRAYHERLTQNSDLWCAWSEKYINWRQLELLGLMSKGNWA